jgi:hypothetical protein
VNRHPHFTPIEIELDRDFALLTTRADGYHVFSLPAETHKAVM